MWEMFVPQTAQEDSYHSLRPERQDGSQERMGKGGISVRVKLPQKGSLVKCPLAQNQRSVLHAVISTRYIFFVHFLWFSLKF